MVAVATDPAIEELYKLVLGPVIEAFTDRTVIRTDDSTVEHRWPAWQQAVVRLRLRTELHVPLMTANNLIGVLSLYHVEPKAFSHDDIAIAELIAAHTAIALDTARTAADLSAAADARRLVGQAMGILLERHDVDERRAFAILRRFPKRQTPNSATSLYNSSRHASYPTDGPSPPQAADGGFPGHGPTGRFTAGTSP